MSRPNQDVVLFANQGEDEREIFEPYNSFNIWSNASHLRSCSHWCVRGIKPEPTAIVDSNITTEPYLFMTTFCSDTFVIWLDNILLIFINKIQSKHCIICSIPIYIIVLYLVLKEKYTYVIECLPTYLLNVFTTCFLSAKRSVNNRIFDFLA